MRFIISLYSKSLSYITGYIADFIVPIVYSQFFLLSIVFSQLYAVSKILKSIPHNVKFILGNCHVVMSMDINSIFLGKKFKLIKLKVTKNSQDTLTQI